MKYIFIVSAILLIAGCDNDGNVSSGVPGSTSVETYTFKTAGRTGSYEDGPYCATVEYNNAKSGTNSTYTLTVDVKDNKLIQINWPKSGWLDNSHFSPIALSNNGSAEITSDKGYLYVVTIHSDGPCASEGTMSAKAPAREESYSSEGEGYVLWTQAGCKYILINIGKWYVVANKSYAFISNGDQVRGNLVKPGYQKFYNISNSEEEEIFVDSYYGSKARAMERIGEKCNQQPETQKAE